MKQHFVDTSAWLASVDADDHEHTQVREALHRNRGTLVTSTYVFDETMTLAKRRLGLATALRLGVHIRSTPGIVLVHVSAQDEASAWTLFQQRRDKPYSFTDCTSFVIMRSLGITGVYTLDDDFRQEGFQVTP